MAGSCGSCALCCKVMAIPELQKADGEWCKHICANHKGCGIYKDRPPVCRNFLCIWRQNPIMGKHMRPDKCGVVFGMGTSPVIVAAYVDPLRPDAWKKRAVWTFIEQVVMNGDFNVVISVVDPAKPEDALKRIIFYKENNLLMRVDKSFTPPDKDGVNWVIHSPDDNPHVYGGHKC